MAYPIKVCVICSEEFELKPDKPGYANRCPECSAADADEGAARDATRSATRSATQDGTGAFDRKSQSEANEARRQAIRDLLYRKDS
jgi:hypothetical protein